MVDKIFIDAANEGPAITAAVIPSASDMPEGSVNSVAPIGNIVHEVTGFRGLDFVPGSPIRKVTKKPQESFPVLTEPGNEDFVDSAETIRRSQYRQKIVDKIQEELNGSLDNRRKRYQKAKAYLDKVAHIDPLNLTDEQREKKQVAETIIREGAPPTEEAILEQARAKALQTIVPKE